MWEGMLLAYVKEKNIPFPVTLGAYTLAMTYDDFKNLCHERRTVRYYDAKPVTKEEVMKLLELARMAPSVENLQPWHFHVIFNHELREKFIKASCYGNFVEGASVFIVVTSNRTYENKAKEPLWNSKELEYSCIAAMQNVLLGATAMGLGSSWVSLFHGAASEIMNFPKHEYVIGGIVLGHYKKGEEIASGEHERKKLEDIYTILE